MLRKGSMRFSIRQWPRETCCQGTGSQDKWENLCFSVWRQNFPHGIFLRNLGPFLLLVWRRQPGIIVLLLAVSLFVTSVHLACLGVKNWLMSRLFVSLVGVVGFPHGTPCVVVADNVSGHFDKDELLKVDTQLYKFLDLNVYILIGQHILAAAGSKQEAPSSSRQKKTLFTDTVAQSQHPSSWKRQRNKCADEPSIFMANLVFKNGKWEWDQKRCRMNATVVAERGGCSNCGGHFMPHQTRGFGQDRSIFVSAERRLARLFPCCLHPCIQKSDVLCASLAPFLCLALSAAGSALRSESKKYQQQTVYMNRMAAIKKWAPLIIMALMFLFYLWWKLG